MKNFHVTPDTKNFSFKERLLKLLVKWALTGVNSVTLSIYIFINIFITVHQFSSHRKLAM